MSADVDGLRARIVQLLDAYADDLNRGRAVRRGPADLVDVLAEGLAPLLAPDHVHLSFHLGDGSPAAAVPMLRVGEPRELAQAERFLRGLLEHRCHSVCVTLAYLEQPSATEVGRWRAADERRRTT